MLQIIRHYILNILISLDQLLNTIIAGDPDETISSRVGKAAQRSKIAKVLESIINLMFWPFKGNLNHCQQSIEVDEGSDSLSKY